MDAGKLLVHGWKPTTPVEEAFSALKRQFIKDRYEDDLYEKLKVGLYVTQISTYKRRRSSIRANSIRTIEANHVPPVQNASQGPR